MKHGLLYSYLKQNGLKDTHGFILIAKVTLTFALILPFFLVLVELDARQHSIYIYISNE